jgi:hypothetical protein
MRHKISHESIMWIVGGFFLKDGFDTDTFFFLIGKNWKLIISNNVPIGLSIWRYIVVQIFELFIVIVLNCVDVIHIFLFMFFHMELVTSDYQYWNRYGNNYKKNQFIHLIVNGNKNCMLEMKYLLKNYRENQKKIRNRTNFFWKFTFVI